MIPPRVLIPSVLLLNSLNHGHYRHHGNGLSRRELRIWLGVIWALMAVAVGMIAELMWPR